MTLITTYINGNRQASVFKDKEQSCYVVKLFEDDKELHSKTQKSLGIAEDFAEDWILGEPVYI